MLGITIPAQGGDTTMSSPTRVATVSGIQLVAPSVNQHIFTVPAGKTFVPMMFTIYFEQVNSITTWNIGRLSLPTSTKPWADNIELNLRETPITGQIKNYRTMSIHKPSLLSSSGYNGFNLYREGESLHLIFGTGLVGASCIVKTSLFGYYV